MLHAFTAKEHGKIFDSIKFLATATAKNPVYNSKFSTVIKVENRVGVATDGSRLHHAIDVALPNGCYQPVKNTKTTVHLVEVENVDFPGWQQLPLDPECRETIDIVDADLDHISFAIARNTHKDVVFNLEYLKPLCDDMWTVHLDPHNGPLVAKNCTKTALVMPRRRQY